MTIAELAAERIRFRSAAIEAAIRRNADALEEVVRQRRQRVIANYAAVLERVTKQLAELDEPVEPGPATGGQPDGTA